MYEAIAPRRLPQSGLDTPPPSPIDLVKPGDSTMSLLGAENVNGPGAGASINTPTGRALSGVMKMMQGANDVESVIPGAIPPPLMQLIQTLMTMVPEIVRNMQQMTGPGGMLSSMGAAPMNPMTPMPGGMPGGMGAGAPNGMSMGEGNPLAGLARM